MTNDLCPTHCAIGMIVVTAKHIMMKEGWERNLNSSSRVHFQCFKAYITAAAMNMNAIFQPTAGIRSSRRLSISRQAAKAHNDAKKMLNFEKVFWRKAIMQNKAQANSSSPSWKFSMKPFSSKVRSL